MKKALVTGAAGFIGTSLVNVLLKKGYSVFALIEKGDSASENKLKAMDASIFVIDDMDALIKDASKYDPFDSIFHLATVGVRPEFNDIELICDVNIKLGCRLVNFAKANGARVFVNFGSCFEYGDHDGELLTENMTCAPESLYAISKNASTNLITGYAKNQNVNMITVRPFGVFGEGEGLNRLAPSIIAGCLKGEEIATTQGEQIRDFVNVKDVAKAIVELSEAEYEPYEIYNICSDNPVRVRDFITEIVAVCGFDINLIKFGSLPYRANEAMIFAGKNDKLQKVIHYPFPADHKEGIIDIYNSLRKK